MSWKRFGRKQSCPNLKLSPIALKDCGKPRNTSVRIATVAVDIQSDLFQNM
jgi:hypothetical protein